MSKQPTVLEKLKELNIQRDALMAEAKTEALANAEAAISQLNELGFSYFLGSHETVERPKARLAKAEGEKGARHIPKDVPCPICNFRTDRPHDRRSHRSQTKTRPFTDKELEALGMK